MSSWSTARRAMCSGSVTRLASSALGLALWFGVAAARPWVRVVVQGSALAGFRHHAATEVWDELRVGDALVMARAAVTPHDASAVSVFWRGRKLGSVPRRENAALAWGLDRGEPLRARISRLTPHPNPSKRLEFEVYAQ